MLKIVEYGIFAVSLLIVFGLIVSGTRKRTDAGVEESPEATDQESAAPIGSTRRP